MSKKQRLKIMMVVVMVIVMGGAFYGNAETEKKSSVAKNLQTKPGLLIIAHGAPFPEWNKPVLVLEKQVVELLGQDNPFAAVKVAMMEFAKPTIADRVREMEKMGCSRIVAVPLLIAPSSHSHWDVPALLGLYSDDEMKKELESEGLEVVQSKLPITITPTLNHGDLIPEVLLDRVKALSKNSEDEALILLAHGDEMTPPLWDELMKRTMTYICGKTGISYADYAFVHVGQSYDTNGVSIIAQAAENRKRVIVVGAYLSMGVDGMHARYVKTFPMKAMSMPGLVNPLEKVDLALATDGLLPDKRVAQWIVDIAKREATSRN